MRNEKPKPNLKKIAYILFLLFLIYSFIGNLRLFIKARNNLTQAQTTLETMTKESEDLNKKLSEASKVSYIEKVARETLGLAHEDELVLVLPPEEELKKLSPRKILDEKEEKFIPPTPHWQEWLKLFI